jgi:hypothetical protein
MEEPQPEAVRARLAVNCSSRMSLIASVRAGSRLGAHSAFEIDKDAIEIVGSANRSMMPRTHAMAPMAPAILGTRQLRSNLFKVVCAYSTRVRILQLPPTHIARSRHMFSDVILTWTIVPYTNSLIGDIQYEFGPFGAIGLTN